MAGEDEAKVRGRWPEAEANLLQSRILGAGKWLIFDGPTKWAACIGAAETEAAAWTDASRRLDELTRRIGEIREEGE